MIHLDTHVALWTHARRASQISATAQRLIERGPNQISPMVVLEMGILHEQGRLQPTPDAVLADLEARLGLTVSDAPFQAIVMSARRFAWTRDPFDRLIVANAIAEGVRLITADTAILSNFRDAVW